jgi:hypothetical protein
MESKILKLVEKYDVEIELKFKKNTIIAIISDGNETKLIENGWLNNLMASIEAECAMMHSKQIARVKELNKTLKNLDATIFPNDLFSKEN